MGNLKTYWREMVVTFFIIGTFAYLSWDLIDVKQELDNKPAVIVTDERTEPSKECVWEITPEGNGWNVDVLCEFD